MLLSAAMRILVINPLLPSLKMLGACEQDRLISLDDLQRLGHDVHVLTLSNPHHPLVEHQAYYAKRGVVQVKVVPYPRQRLSPARLRNVAYLLDGAAWEYATPRFRQAVEKALQQVKPDVVWCHTSYLWPPARMASHHGFPTVIRSVNYESSHVLQEDGRTLGNWLRYFGKEMGERWAARRSSVLAAITPDEQQIYQAMAPGHPIHLLPLRTLPRLLRPPHRVLDRRPLHVFFMGASYNVPHNRAALDFVVGQVVPRVRNAAPERFVFHVIGGKIPHEMRNYAAPDLILDGYVDDIDAHLDKMDIALVPSRFGQGMQQKVFEALCRGFPTITTHRALAGYLFEDASSIMLADDAEASAAQLLRLEDPALRARTAAGASQQAAALFSQPVLDSCMAAILAAAIRSTD
jgi:glycosyltransferase involved in cell wall biosynthesis